MIDGLLIKEKVDRLGSKNGFKEIVNHPFFKGFNWDDMINRKIKAPYVPETGGDNWKRNFDDLDGSSNLFKSIAESTFDNFNN